MTSTRITKALAHASDTRRIEIGSGILSCTGPLFAATTGAPEAMIVADETTWSLAGPAVRTALTASGIALADPLVFPADPPVYAGYENVTRIRRRLLESGATACSIGSGTISDLVKLASGELARPYVHVCTAASMDGYAAFGAAISKDGFKITRACPAPAGIVADLDIIATAPPMMTANGYADLTEKFTGGADWIIADALGIEPIAPFAWGLVQDGLREALAHPDAARTGERGVLEGLVEEAMLAGLAIQVAQSSRPGSGVGHNFSHQWEMEGYGLDWPLPLSHGAKVGIGTMAIAAVYDAVLSRDFADVDAAEVAASWPTPQENEARVRALQSVPAIAEAAVGQAAGKYISRDEIPSRVAAIQEAWPQIRTRLRSQVPPAAEIRGMLEAVGAPYHPAMIGISLEKFRHTYYQAQTIRSRYAILDVLFETGTLDDVVASLFAPGGFWAEEPVPAESIVP